jgi:diketogulonate reductase-like aldo/keto reductase
LNSKDFPRTTLRLPEIGFGTWNYHGGVEPIRNAIGLGACLIDTAEAYETEEIVGEAIRHVRARVFVSTKVRPRYFRHADLLRAADQSLKRLRTDHIDLYQLHWPNYAVPLAETMAAMEELVTRGKVRFIGVSNFSVSDLEKAQAALSKYKIAANQVRYSLVDRTVEGGILPYCQARGIAVIAHSPLAQGLACIESRDPDHCLRRVAATTGKTVAQVALNWCISKDGVVAIPKASTLEHVQDDCGASGWRLSVEHLDVLDRGIRFRRRRRAEVALRRLARRSLQKLGYNR